MAESRSDAGRETGIIASLRGLAATAVELIRTRLELLSVELEEERARITRMVVLSVAAAFFFILGALTLTFFVVLLAWESHRLLAAGLLAAAYIALGVILALNARAVVQKRSRLFATSLAELRKDREKLG